MFLAVYGEDALRVREFTEDLLEKFVAKYDPSRLNVEVFDFATVAKDTLVPCLQAAPFLAEKRFLFLKNIAETLKKTDVSFWTELFGRLDASTSICFVDVLDEAKWKKTPLGTWLATLSQEGVKYFSLPRLSRTECLAWIRARAAKMGFEISENIAAVLYDRVGGVGQDLWMEIHKLSAYAGASALSKEMIEQLVPRHAASDFFAFLDLLPTAQPHELVQALCKEEASGADAFALFGGLLRQLRVLTSVTSLLHSGVTGHKEIAETLELHPFVVQKAIQASGYFSLPKLQEALEKAVSWDRGTKSGLSAEMMVDRLLEELLFARKSFVS